MTKEIKTQTATNFQLGPSVHYRIFTQFLVNRLTAEKVPKCNF